MSRILIISAVFPPEPVISAMLSKDIADSLSLLHQVVVLCPQPSRPEGFIFQEQNEPTNYKVERLNSFVCPSSNLFGRFRESFSFGQYCSRYIKKNRSNIDCIYINSWPLFSQLKIIKIANKFDIPCILHIQDIYPESLSHKLPVMMRKLVSQFFSPMDKFVLNNVNKVIGISPDMISYLWRTRNVKREKFELVRNWQNDEQFLNHFGKVQGDMNGFIFMYVGSISVSAGISYLIKAFNKINLPNVKLIIAGDGADKVNCRAIAGQMQNDKIKFCEVTPDKVPELQSQADVLILPLKKGIAKTATPSKLTAYLLSSKPVIATVEPNTDVANILTTARCGLVVDPESVDALYAGLKKAYNLGKSELKKMGDNGKDYAEMNLSKKANLKKVVTIIEDTLEETLNGN